MKTIRTSALLIPLMTILLMGCKRESLNHEPVAQQPGMGEKLQAWYESRPAIQTANPAKTISKSDHQLSKPDWNATNYYPASQLFVSPVKFDTKKTAVSSNFQKYLVGSGTPDGNINSGKYIYLITKKTDGPAPAYVQNAEPAFLMQQKIPEAFTGAVFEYDLDNNFLSGKYYEQGRSTDKITRLSYKSGGVNTSANYEDPGECEGEMICTDWYWQTWVNGELVYEEYLFTTCECNSGTGGGGGGGTPTPPTPLQMCQVAVQNILNATNSANLRLSNDIESQTPLKRTRIYSWKCVQGFGWYVVAYDKGVQIRDKINTPWKWESLVNLGISKQGNSATYGGTITATKVLIEPVMGTYHCIMNSIVNIKATVTYAGVTFTNEKDVVSHYTYYPDTEPMPGY